MVRQPGTKNQSVIGGGDHAGCRRDTGSVQSHDNTSLLLPRLLPKSESAGARRAGASPAALNLRAGRVEAQAHPSRSGLLGCALSVLDPLETGLSHRQA